jgi:regulatory protein
VKVINELRRKEVPMRLIHEALQQIDDQQYNETLNDLGRKKLRTLTGRRSLKTRATLQRFLIGKGFEGDLVRKVVKRLLD